MPKAKKRMTTTKPKPKKTAPSKPSKREATPLDGEVEAVLAALKRLGNTRVRKQMASRYGIYTDKAFGIPIGTMQKLAKGIRGKDAERNHALALALWDTGWYEARTVAALIDDPERVTPAQMDRWAGEFDNWAICDTVCFKLFDRSPHAFAKVKKWCGRREEFVKRAGFALLACLALHDLQTDDVAFARCLPLVEAGAADHRNFVKKGVSWALRAIGGRSRELRAAAAALAQRLTASPKGAARWVGNDALGALMRKPTV